MARKKKEENTYNKLTDEQKTEITRKLETFLQFHRIPRFQNHRNKIIIQNTEKGKIKILIQRPLEKFTPRELDKLNVKDNYSIDVKYDGLSYEVLNLVYTPDELDKVLQDL